MEDGLLYRMASVKVREKILEDFDLRYGDKKEAKKSSKFTVDDMVNIIKKNIKNKQR